MSGSSDNQLIYERMSARLAQLRKEFETVKTQSVINGEKLAVVVEEVEKIRHDCVCLVVANRYDIDAQEKSIYDCIEPLLRTEAVKSRAAVYDGFRKTPDLFYKTETQVGEKNIKHTLTFFEIAVAYSVPEATERKIHKYSNIIAHAGKLINESMRGRKEEASVHLVTVIISNTLSNWTSCLNTLSRGEAAGDFEYKCYELCAGANEFSQMILDIYSSISKVEQQRFERTRTHSREQISRCFLDNINMDFDAINARLDKLDGIMPRFESNFRIEENEDSVLTNFIRCLKDNWKDVETGFEKPTVESFNESIEHLTAEMSEKYKPVNKDKIPPSFPFMYILKEKSHRRGYRERFEYFSNLVKRGNANGKEYCQFVKDIFSLEKLTMFEKQVFFSEHAYENWEEVKKELHSIFEPKTLKKKVLSEAAREVLKLAGVGQKKAKLEERKTEEHRDSRKEMVCLNWWDAEIQELINTEVDEKASWFVSEKLVTSKPKKLTEDDALNNCYNKWANSAAHEYYHHINTVAKHVMFRGNSASRGFNVINTGNDNVWVITLPGGDLNSDYGDVRFIQVCAIEEEAYKEFKGDFVFNHELIAESFTSGNKIILVSRWLSINKNRWEHLERINPIPFISLMDSRSEGAANIKYLAYVYMYAALGCHAKTSALIDNFRYMIPASIAELSGLKKYVQEKFDVPIKTIAQGYIMKELMHTVVKYIDESKSLKIRRQEFLDDTLEESTGGLHGSLRSAFVKDYWWNSKDFALAEIYVAFHLTGKGLHNINHRDIEFVKIVMGGEVEFKDMIETLFKQDEIQFGVGWKKSPLLFTMKRGGCFNKEAVLLSGMLATNLCYVEKDRFNSYIDKERLHGSILAEKLLCSSKSAIRRAFFDRGTYVLETQTLLENTLEEVEKECPDILQDLKVIVDQHIQLKEQAEKIHKETPKQDSSSESSSSWSGGSSGQEASTEGSDESARLISKSQKKQTEDSFKMDIKQSYGICDRLMDLKLIKIKDPEIAEEIVRHHEIQAIKPLEFTDLEKQTGDKVLNKQTVKEIEDIYKSLTIKENLNLAEQLETLDMNVYGDYKPFINSQIRRDSIFYHAFLNMMKVPKFKIVAKGQRTHVDREIFIQNQTRYVNYVQEHLMKAVCKLLPKECITVPGDDKLKKLKTLYERGQIWKATNTEVDGIKMKKTVMYITGDMTKFSNHDTSYRLRMFLEGARCNLSSMVYNTLVSFIRIDTRKMVIAPTSLHKKIKEDDDLMKIFDRCNSEFPECAMTQNWLQGMRNYIASAAHHGACQTMERVFRLINGRDLYFDFLVHSDDWVICYGYSVPEFSDKALNYDFTWRRELGIVKDEEVGKFMLNSIYMIYKLNNLSMSVKKSSISSKFVEFVSYCVNGGSCYMGGEKQLTAIFSELKGTGPREDMQSLLSNCSSAVTKGIPSTTVDLFRNIAVSQLRKDYSMDDGQKFDPVGIFKTSRDLLPLCFIPDITETSMKFTLTSPELHDYMVLADLRSRLISEECTDEEKRAAKLFVNMSLLMLGQTAGSRLTNAIDLEEPLIPGLKFQVKGIDLKKDSIALNSVFREKDLDFMSALEFTSGIMKPTDIGSLLLQLHYRLFNHDFLTSISGISRTSCLRTRGGFKVLKSCKVSCMEEWDTMANVFKFIKAHQMLTEDKTCIQLIKTLETLCNKLTNIEVSVVHWLKSMDITVSKRKKTRPQGLVRLPMLTQESLTINPIRLLLVQKVNYDRFRLNRVELPRSHCIAEDMKKVDAFMKGAGYSDSLCLKEKKQVLEIISRASDDERKAPTILSTGKRHLTSYDQAVRWLFRHNMSEKFEYNVTPYYNIDFINQIIDTKKKSKFKCQKMISNLALLCRYSIENPSFKFRTLDQASPKRLTSTIITECTEQDFDISMKHKYMLAFLQLHYVGTSSISTNLYLKEFTIHYIKTDRKWTYKSAYTDCVFIVTKGVNVAKFDFEDGKMTIQCDYSGNKYFFKEMMKFIYYKHKRYYNIDNYKYLQGVDMENVSYNQLFVSGSDGEYDVGNKTSGFFSKENCIAVLIDSSYGLPSGRTQVEASPSKSGLEYIINETCIAKINYPTTSADLRAFEYCGPAHHVDINFLLKMGVFDEFIISGSSVSKISLSECFTDHLNVVGLKSYKATVSFVRKVLEEGDVYEIEFNEEIQDLKKEYKQRQQEMYDIETDQIGKMVLAGDSDIELDIDWDTTSSSRSSDEQPDPEATPKDLEVVTLKYTERTSRDHHLHKLNKLSDLLMSQALLHVFHSIQAYVLYCYTVYAVDEVTEIDIDTFAEKSSPDDRRKMNILLSYCSYMRSHPAHLDFEQVKKQDLIKFRRLVMANKRTLDLFHRTTIAMCNDLLNES
uniref:RNA-directed RNA polymerase L n=1 Tax=Coptotermes formosanus bunya-like virus 2 TaxID=3133451 RepID=A0AAT9J9Y9_9VIRU